MVLFLTRGECKDKSSERESYSMSCIDFGAKNAGVESRKVCLPGVNSLVTDPINLNGNANENCVKSFIH